MRRSFTSFAKTKDRHVPSFRMEQNIAIISHIDISFSPIVISFHYMILSLTKQVHDNVFISRLCSIVILVITITNSIVNWYHSITNFIYTHNWVLGQLSFQTNNIFSFKMILCNAQLFHEGHITYKSKYSINYFKTYSNIVIQYMYFGYVLNFNL